MTLEQERSSDFTDLVARLSETHEATAADIVAAVQSATAAVELFGGTRDAEMLALAETIAVRDLRLRLGLDKEAARLDPETRTRRAAADPDA